MRDPRRMKRRYQRGIVCRSTLSLETSARDRAGGVLCSAHVPRHRPAAGASSFTSLRTAPHRPDRGTPWRSTVANSQRLPPRAAGGRRSEVKEEGRAQPAPGDVSGGCHPLALACADLRGLLLMERCEFMFALLAPFASLR
jgi:hypothetical protein